MALITGSTRTGHDETCRLRVIDKMSQGVAGAARVKVARTREEERQAKKLEKGFANKPAREAQAEASSSTSPAQNAKDGAVRVAADFDKFIVERCEEISRGRRRPRPRHGRS